MTPELESPQPGLGDHVATFAVRLFRLLLRLLFVLLLGTALGVAAYFGGPALYRNYIEPVRLNTERIAHLEQALAQAQSEARQDRATWNGRLADIEGRLAAQAEELAALKADLNGQGSRLNALADLPSRVASLTRDLEQTSSQIAAIEASLAEAETPTEQLGRKLQLVRAMELLTRARLWLTQDNLGLAASDIQATLDVLTETAADAPEAEVATLTPIIERLNLALEDLRTSPIVAADDLEIAWRLLVAASGP